MDNQQITTDSAYKRLKKEIREWRMSMTMMIAEKKNVEDYDHLIDFIVNDMRSKNLDIKNEDLLDDYLRSEALGTKVVLS
jgi:hypothetical protein